MTPREIDLLREVVGFGGFFDDKEGDIVYVRSSDKFREFEMSEFFKVLDKEFLVLNMNISDIRSVIAMEEM